MKALLTIAQTRWVTAFGDAARTLGVVETRCEVPYPDALTTWLSLGR